MSAAVKRVAIQKKSSKSPPDGISFGKMDFQLGLCCRCAFHNTVRVGSPLPDQPVMAFATAVVS